MTEYYDHKLPQDYHVLKNQFTPKYPPIAIDKSDSRLPQARDKPDRLKEYHPLFKTGKIYNQKSNPGYQRKNFFKKGSAMLDTGTVRS